MKEGFRPHVKTPEGWLGRSIRQIGPTVPVEQRFTKDSYIPPETSNTTSTVKVRVRASLVSWVEAPLVSVGEPRVVTGREFPRVPPTVSTRTLSRPLRVSLSPRSSPLSCSLELGTRPVKRCRSGEGRAGYGRERTPSTVRKCKHISVGGAVRRVIVRTELQFESQPLEVCVCLFRLGLVFTSIRVPPVPTLAGVDPRVPEDGKGYEVTLTFQTPGLLSDIYPLSWGPTLFCSSEQILILTDGNRPRRHPRPLGHTFVTTQSRRHVDSWVESI